MNRKGISIFALLFTVCALVETGLPGPVLAQTATSELLDQLDLDSEQRLRVEELTTSLVELPFDERGTRLREGLREILSPQQRRELFRLSREQRARSSDESDRSTAPREGLVRVESLAPERLERYRAAATYSASRRGVSLVVMRDGQVEFEDYPNGGAADRGNRLASGTKSFSCALAAAAAEDGLVDLDAPASRYLPAWREDPEKSKVAVRQLLDLTAGLDNEVALIPTYRDAVEAPLRDPPGTVFRYGARSFQAFGEILRRTTEEDPLAYLKRRVLDPIGVSETSWARGSDGNPRLSAGAAFTALDWARFGQLILDGGRSGDARILDGDRLGECFEGTALNPAYGLTWWLNEPVTEEQRRKIPLLRRATDLMGAEGLPSDVVMAAGAGNQRLYVIPSRGLVVVRQAEGILDARAGRGGGFSDAEFLRLLLAPPAPAAAGPSVR